MSKIAKPSFELIFDKSAFYIMIAENNQNIYNDSIIAYKLEKINCKLKKYTANLYYDILRKKHTYNPDKKLLVLFRLYNKTKG